MYEKQSSKTFARKISEQFNEVINGIRYRINSARIESANAAIKRIQAKAWGGDVRYLFLKLCQVYFMRLQRKHKTPRSYYQQIRNRPETDPNWYFALYIARHIC